MIGSVKSNFENGICSLLSITRNSFKSKNLTLRSKQSVYFATVGSAVSSYSNRTLSKPFYFCLFDMYFFPKKTKQR